MGTTTKKTYKQLEQDYQNLEQRYNSLHRQLDDLRRMIFGQKSERFISDVVSNQLSLGLEGQKQKVEEKNQPETQTISYTRKKKKEPSRQALPDHLPRAQQIIEPEEDTTGMKLIGEEITEILAKQPSRLFVIQFIRKKYAKADGSGIVIGKLPSRAIQKGLAHEMVLADILVSKYVDHLPLYRQAKIFAREGVKIATSTMNDWVKASCKLLEPLYEALKKDILLNDYLQVDESPIKVLDRKKKGKTHLGYHWLYHSIGVPLVLFDYQKGRGREGPRQMLKDFKGYLQTDGYTVYDEFGKNKDITLMGCMAHARRYFDKALDNDQARAQHFLAEVQQLYALESNLRDQQADWKKRLSARQELALPILNRLRVWLKTEQAKVLPKSAIGKAINYSLVRWDKLCVYAGNGGLEIDNNLIENQVRPLALGRKNYLFAGSHQGAKHAAILYSLFGSCKLNGLDPFKYLHAVLDKLPDHPIIRISELLPCYVRFEEEG